MQEDSIEPPLMDDSGYRVTRNDLSFLDVADTSFMAFQRKQHPLGCDPDEWKQFVEMLQRALDSDSIADADVRLQGSAAHFFSGMHKAMPYSVEEVADLFIHLRGRIPIRRETERIATDLARAWPNTANRPRRRPFDSLFRLQIDRVRSDLDVQVSSAEIVKRVHDYLEVEGLPPSKLLIEHERYAFVRKEHVATVCPNLTDWALRQTNILRRPVAVAVFGDCGPPEVPGPQSSHFKPDDWLVPLGVHR